MILIWTEGMALIFVFDIGRFLSTKMAHQRSGRVGQGSIHEHRMVLNSSAGFDISMDR